MAELNLRQIIKAKMRQSRVSVPALARSVECNQQTLYNYLQDKSALSSDILQKVLQELNIKIG